MRLRTILVPVDDSAASLKAASYAADMAKTYGAALVFVNCQPAVSPALGNPNARQAHERHEADALDVLAPYLRLCEEYDLPCRDLALEGPVAATIADAARAEKADLVIVGTRGKGDLEGLLHGSVTHDLLLVSPCPVLVVR